MIRDISLSGLCCANKRKKLISGKCFLILDEYAFLSMWRKASISSFVSAVLMMAPFLTARLICRFLDGSNRSCGGRLCSELYTLNQLTGKYWFFLNNDTLIEEDNFPNLIKRLESDPQIIGVSPLIRDCNQHRTIQYAGYTPLSAITLRNQAIGEGTTDASAFPAKETPYLHGAAMLFKREVIQQVGKMPEIFFLYYEELDWCTAMNRQGYTLWFEPSCEILHKGSSTIGDTSPLKAFYLSRNRLLYAYRNRTGLTRILCILYLLCIATPVQCMRAILHRQKGICQAHLRGIHDFIKLKSKMS